MIVSLTESRLNTNVSLLIQKDFLVTMHDTINVDMLWISSLQDKSMLIVVRWDIIGESW